MPEHCAWTIHQSIHKAPGTHTFIPCACFWNVERKAENPQDTGKDSVKDSDIKLIKTCTLKLSQNVTFKLP